MPKIFLKNKVIVYTKSPVTEERLIKEGFIHILSLYMGGAVQISSPLYDTCSGKDYMRKRKELDIIEKADKEGSLPTLIGTEWQYDDNLKLFEEKLKNG